MNGRSIRLARLFNRDENVVIVAADHGEFDGPIPGMIDLPNVLENINPAVDGVLLSPGMVERCRHVFSFKGAPLAVVRLNWSTVYCFHWEYHQAHTARVVSAREAVALGADIALISLTLQTGSEETDARNVEVFCRLAQEAKGLGLPILGEVFPVNGETLAPDDLHAQVKAGARIVAELGADMIKTFYTHKFREVTESCPIPIFGLGAKRLPTQLAALDLAASEIRDGARGVVFGRNAIQAPDPKAFQAALCDVVKRAVTPAEAVETHGLKDT